MILHYENEKLYGIDRPERCFEMLQENGIYYGHGGAASGTYRSMSFANGTIMEIVLAVKDWGEYHIAGKKVSEKKFLKWEEKNCVGEVEYYAPTKIEKLEE